MGPKRRGAAAPAPRQKKKSRIAIAKDLSLSPEEESEIRSAFELFTDPDELGPDMVSTEDVPRAFLALGFSLPHSEVSEILFAVDADDTGVVSYDIFLEVCAMKIRDRDAMEEVDKAYKLFTGGGEGPITLAHLKKVARSLNENVSEETLKDMLAEASSRDVGRVDKRDFEGVMRRAGMM